MLALGEALGDAQRRQVAIGHFNVSDLVALKAVTAAACALNVPVLIGTSEGERDFIGVREIAAVVAALREETGQPIGTLNAFLRDICHIIDGIICYIGYLFPLWDPKRQTIADKIMKTVVVPANN